MAWPAANWSSGWLSLDGWVLIYSKERRIASGIGGPIGRWSPLGWYPNSSAVYVNWIGWPFGATYWDDPWTPLPPSPDSWPDIPFAVSKKYWYDPSGEISWDCRRTGAIWSCNSVSADTATTRKAVKSCWRKYCLLINWFKKGFFVTYKEIHDTNCLRN